MSKLLYCLLIAFSVCLFADSQDSLSTVQSEKDMQKINSLLNDKNHTLHDYHIAIHEIAAKDTNVIRYVVASCNNVVGRDKASEYTLPRSVISGTIFALDHKSGNYVTYGEYIINPHSYIAFSELNKEQFTALVLHAYAQLPRNFEVKIDSHIYHRDSVIDAIERGNNLGQKMVAIERIFLRAAENNFWEYEVETHTDAAGNFALDSFSFAADSNLLASIQISWRGTHELFSHATFVVNGKKIFDAEALNYESYIVAHDVQAKNNSCRVTAEGGPANKAVKVLLADCG